MNDILIVSTQWQIVGKGICWWILSWWAHDYSYHIKTNDWSENIQIIFSETLKEMNLLFILFL